MHAQTRILFSFQESRSQNSEERGQNQLTGLSLPFWLLNSGFHIPLLFSGISRGEAPCLVSFWRETKDPEGVKQDSPGREPWVQGPDC